MAVKEPLVHTVELSVLMKYTVLMYFLFPGEVSPPSISISPLMEKLYRKETFQASEINRSSSFVCQKSKYWDLDNDL